MIFNSTDAGWLGKDEYGGTTLEVGRTTVYTFNPILWSFREAISEGFGTPSVADMAARWLEVERTRPWSTWGTPAMVEHARKVLTRLANPELFPASTSTSEGDPQ